MSRGAGGTELHVLLKQEGTVKALPDMTRDKIKAGQFFKATSKTVR